MRYLVLILVGLVAAAGLGYFVGYDHGFQKHAAEGVNTEAPSALTGAALAMSRLVGVWQSSDDPKFTREIRNDGSVVDHYAGSPQDTEGHWLVFTKEVPDDSFAGALEDGAVYLSIAQKEGDTLHFKITDLDDASLQMSSLDHGGTLTFSRTK